MLKEKTNKKDITEVTRSEDKVAEKSKRTKEEKKHKVNKEEYEFPEDYVQLSSRNFSGKRTLRKTKKHHLKIEEKRNMFGSEELSERLIEEVAKRIGRAPTNTPIDKALEAMREISKLPFTSWIIQNSSPENSNL